MSITINGVVYRNLEDQVAYLTEGYNDLYPVLSYMPTDVSSINKLASKSYVDQAVTTVSAHYLTSNVAGDNFSSKAALIAGPYYYGGTEHTPDENDYAFVNADEDHDNKPSRYCYINNEWNYQYSITGVAGGVVDLTSAQTITGVKNFSNGIKIRTKEFTFNDEYNAFLFQEGTSIAVGGNIIPHRTQPTYSRNIGTTSYRWNNLYLSGNIDLGNNANIQYLSDYGQIVVSKGMYINGTTSTGDLIPVDTNYFSLGNENKKWKDLYLSGNIIGAYREANSVSIASGFATGSFTISQADVERVKYIEIYITHNGVSYSSLVVPVAAWRMSDWTSAVSISTGNMDYDTLNVIYSNGTLTTAISFSESGATVEMFLKMI